MKKLLVLILSCLIFIPNKVLAEEVHIYLFHSRTCGICDNEIRFLDNIDNDNVKIHKFEISGNIENYNTMQKIKELYNISREGVPFTVVGDTAILGFSDAYANKINRLISKYEKTDYYDRTGVQLGLYQDTEIIEIESGIVEEDNEKLEEKDENNFFWIYFGISVLVLLVINYGYLYKKKIKSGE